MTSPERWSALTVVLSCTHVALVSPERGGRLGTTNLDERDAARAAHDERWRMVHVEQVSLANDLVGGGRFRASERRSGVRWVRGLGIAESEATHHSPAARDSSPDGSARFVVDQLLPAVRVLPDPGDPLDTPDAHRPSRSESERGRTRAFLRESFKLHKSKRARELTEGERERGRGENQGEVRLGSRGKSDARRMLLICRKSICAVSESSSVQRAGAK